ncbi:MAG: hypothetical protein LRY40_05000, partial [Shewanella fodinae]|nr:hypothetical protein [Shewanella fodinae]
MGNESDGIQFQPNSGNKNLSRILCPKTLPPIFRAATLASLKQLLKEMPDEFWERYETLEHRANHRRYKVGLRFFSEDQKTAAYEHLVRQRILTECGFAAAINTRANPSLSDADAVQYRRFQILVIVSCLQLYLIGGHECAIENALREMRLIATEASHMPVLGVLPNITPNQDLEALIETIRTHRTQSYTSPLIERGLGFIFVAIYDAYRFAKGIRRYRKSTKLPIQEHYVDLIEREKLDDTSVAIEEL